MELIKAAWISGQTAGFTADAVEVPGAVEASVQVTGPLNSAAYLQGSIDGVAFETLDGVAVASGDVNDGTEIKVINSQGSRFLRVHLINDGGGTPTVSATIR